MYRVVVAVGQPACQNPPFPGLIPFLIHGLPLPAVDALCRHSDATGSPLEHSALLERAAWSTWRLPRLVSPRLRLHFSA